MQLPRRTSEIGFIFFALFFVLTPSSKGQDSLLFVHGKVVSEDGTPIADATVTLVELSISTKTDDNGGYEFRSVPFGIYSFLIKHISYSTIKTKIMVSSKIRFPSLAYTMTMKPVELSGITVIGSNDDYLKLKKDLTRIPGSVALVSSQEISKTRQANLRDVLRYVPGVWTQSRFGAADESQLSVRGSGLRNNFHLRGINILVNGMPYRNADGFTDFESLELLTTSNVQIYKGGNSIRYGGSTLGGGVNLETKTGYTSNPIQFYGSGGSFGYLKSQVSSGMVIGDNNYYASYARTTLEGYRDYSSQWRKRANLNYGRVFSESFNARLFYFYADVEEDLPGQLTKAQIETDPKQANANNVGNRWGRDYTLHHIGLQFRAKLSDNTRIEFAPYLQYRDIVHPIFRVIDQLSRDIGVEARLENDWNTGDKTHRTSLGVQLAGGNTDNRHYNNVGGNKTTLQKDQKEKAGVIAIYAESIWQLHRNLSVATGLRFDKSRRELIDRFFGDNTDPVVADQSDKRDFEALMPKIGLIYEWRQIEGQVYGNISRSYEPPLLLELNSFTQAGFVDIEAQDAWQFEFGARGSKTAIGWDFSIFMMNIENEIININVQPFPGSPFTVPSYKNAASTKHYGIELGLNTQSNALRQKSREHFGSGARLAYTYSRCKFHNDPVYNNNHLPGHPDHSIQSEFTLWHPSGISFSPNIEWIPRHYAINSENSVHNDGWAILGVRTDYHLLKIGATLAIEVRNLTDAVYSPTVSVDNAAGMFYEPADGRSIYASFTWFK